MSEKSLAAFIVTLLMLAGCDVFTDSKARVTRAEKLLGEGAYNESMVELRNALEDTPDDPRALLLLARTNYQLGRYEPATKALEAAGKAGASPADLGIERARLMLARGEYTQLSAALASGELSMEGAAKQVFMARSLAAQDRCDQALPLARERLALDASQLELRVVVAECLGRRGNSEGALSELESATADMPENAGGWLALGRLQQAMGDRKAAEASWARATKLAPGQLSVPQQAMMHSALADWQIETGDVEGVRRSHSSMLAIAPGSPITELLAAQLSLLEGRHEEAVAASQRLLAADTDFAAARVLLVSSLLAKGTLEQARQQLAAAVGRQPKAANLKTAQDLLAALQPEENGSAAYWVRVAAAQAALGQQAMAKMALERAIPMAPDEPAAATALAGLELRMGRLEEAARRTRDLASRFPENASVLAVLADVQAAQREFAQSAATLDSLFARAPGAAVAVASHRVRMAGKLGGENRLLQSWLATHPEDTKVRALYADSLGASGDHRLAAAELETLVARQPQDAVALNNLAWTYHLLGDPRALPTAARAFELAPRAAPVADTYGWLKVQAGALPEGLKALALADELAGARVSEIRYHYAAALARSGERARARDLLRDLLANGASWDGDQDAKALLQSLEASDAR